MRRFISRILAINRYMDIVIGVTQWPAIQLVGINVFFTFLSRNPSGEERKPKLTSDAARLAGILAAGRVDIAGEHLAVQHEVGLEGDLDNDKLKSPLKRVHQLESGGRRRRQAVIAVETRNGRT